MSWSRDPAFQPEWAAAEGMPFQEWCEVYHDCLWAEYHETGACYDTDWEVWLERGAGSNFGKGQMVAADYTLIPSITFNQRDTSQAGGAIGALVPIAGAVAGSIQTNDASTVLTMIDNRSGVQIVAAEGSARNMDFAGIGAMAAGFGALVGGKTKSPQEKILVAAFMDSYNQMVRAARSYQAQTVKGGLGTGGLMSVDGSSKAVP